MSDVEESPRLRAERERILARQAERGPLREGRHFEHGPAKFIFIGLITVVVLTHLIALAMLKFAP